MRAWVAGAGQFLPGRTNKKTMSQNYRLLNIGETIQDGDDFFHYDKMEWRRSDYQRMVIDEGFATYRRPLPPELYEFVKPGEPLKKGDEIFYSVRDGWIAVVPSIVGDKLQYGVMARRLFNPAPPEPAVEADTVDPGEGYRLLEEGEPIEQGDEFLSSFGPEMVWGRCTGTVGCDYIEGVDTPTRRKVAVPTVTPPLPPPNWRTFDVKPPNATKLILLNSMDGSTGWAWHRYEIEALTVMNNFTHWTTNEEWMASLPKPAPVVDEEREAFEKWAESQGDHDFSKRSCGEYKNVMLQSCFLSWKAALKSLTTRQPTL